MKNIRATKIAKWFRKDPRRGKIAKLAAIGGTLGTIAAAAYTKSKSGSGEY